MIRSLLIYALFYAFCVCNGQCESSQRSLTTEIVNLAPKLTRIQEWFPRFAWPHIESINSNMELNFNISVKCKSALSEFGSNIAHRVKSSLKRIDASGKFRPGFVSKAQQSDLGFYEQCPSTAHRLYFVELDWPLPEYGVETVTLNSEGTWLDKLNALMLVYFTEKQVIMACLPVQCSSEEYRIVASDLLFNRTLPLRVNFIHDDLSNDVVTEHMQLKNTALIILLILVATVFCFTFIQIFVPTSHPIIRALDIHENNAKIFRQSINDRLSFISGYRIIYGYIALVSHLTMTALVQTKYTQAKSIAEMLRVTAIQSNSYPFGIGSFTTTAGFMVVSVNFTLAGMLSYYSWTPVMNATKGRISFIMFAFVRYIRTLPVIVFTLLVVFAFPVNLGSGPVFRTTFNIITQNCIQNGWAELLALSNFFNVDRISLPQAWFISADIQLYLLSYFVIIMLYKRPRVGMAIAGALIFSGIVGHAAILYHFKAKYFMNGITTGMNDMIKEAVIHLYATPTGIPAYFIGILLGYLIVNDMKLDKISRIQPRALFILTVILLVLCVIISNSIYITGVPVFIKYLASPVMRVTLVTTGSIYLYLAWNGSMPEICYLFSLRPFVILAKFSYSTFMAHFLVLWYHLGTFRHQLDYLGIHVLIDSIALYCISNVIGYFFYLIVEAPAMNLVKIMFAKGKKPIV